MGHNNFRKFFGPEANFENDFKIRFQPICIIQECLAGTNCRDFLTLFCGLTIIQQVLARGNPIRQKLEILGKKSLLPKKIFLQLPTSLKKVNMCKKSVKIILCWFRNAISCRKIFFGKNNFFHLLSKKNFLHEIALRNQLSMIFTDFLHMFTFLKLVGRFRKTFFGKSDFFPKIPNFCHIELPLVKTYWMIVSPQKWAKKYLDTICTCHAKHFIDFG